MTIRILLADDQPLIRAGFRMILEDEDGMTVVGEAADGAEGVALAERTRPDVITMDIEMPVLNGVAATARLCELGFTAIVIVSGSASSDHIGAALAAGARWHVSKRDILRQLPSVLAAAVS